MALVQQGSSYTEIGSQLNLALGNKHSMLRYTISVDQNYHPVLSLGGPIVQHMSGSQRVTLELQFQILNDPENQLDIVSVETRLMEFLHAVNGTLVSRSVHPFRENYISELTYSAILHNYEEFLVELERYSRKEFEKQFTQELEVKLAED